MLFFLFKKSYVFCFFLFSKKFIISYKKNRKTNDLNSENKLLLIKSQKNLRHSLVEEVNKNQTSLFLFLFLFFELLCD